MNISEAAKKAAEEILSNGRVSVRDGFRSTDIEQFGGIIQSAIDAETAALRDELDALKKRFAHLINNQGHDVDEYYRDEPTEEARPTLHECSVAARDGEIESLKKELRFWRAEIARLKEAIAYHYKNFGYEKPHYLREELEKYFGKFEHMDEKAGAE